jgi:hypothetical protein
MTIRSTFALDPETAQTLERLAARWEVSKSEALRRAVASASREEGVDPSVEALEALDALQKGMGLKEEVAEKWIRAVRAERRSSRP